MLKWLSGGIALSVLFVAFWWFTQDHDKLPVREDMMPWQVTVDASGATSVFGVTLQHTTLDEVVDAFGREAGLALFSRDTENDRLEAYFHNVELGPVIAKVVLTLSTKPDEIAGMRERSVKQEAAPSGIYRYSLNPEDTRVALQRTIEAITYIPSYLRLDEEMVRSKFGEPGSIIEVDDQQTRWFYPKRGLAVLIDKDGKEIFQYVPPTAFETLKKRLDDSADELAESGT